MVSFEQKVSEIWSRQERGISRESRLLSIDALACLEQGDRSRLKPESSVRFFYILMTLILEGYEQLSLLELVEPWILKEILLHHNYRLRADVITNFDPTRDCAQLELYLKLRKKLRDSIYNVLYRPRPGFK